MLKRVLWEDSFQHTRLSASFILVHLNQMCHSSHQIGSTVREDIVWDMENLFVPGHIKDFNLKGFTKSASSCSLKTPEFEQPITPNDVKTLVGALQYNTWFKSLIVKNIALDKVYIFSKSISSFIHRRL